MGGKGSSGKGHRKGNKGGKNGFGGGKGYQTAALDNESIDSYESTVSFHKIQYASDGTAKLWFVEIDHTGWQEWRLACNNFSTNTQYHAVIAKEF